MITSANRITRGGKSISVENSACFRMVAGVIIEGTSSDITESLADITIIPNTVVPSGTLTNKEKEAVNKDTAWSLIEKYVLESALTDNEALLLMDAYPKWVIGVRYSIGYVVVYASTLYKVVQAHTSQSDWTPDVVPALFTKIVPPSVIPLWVQPTGAQDAYALGAKVEYKGAIYQSLITANVWSPEAYPAGWKLL
jgi:hypothetical protein